MDGSTADYADPMEVIEGRTGRRLRSEAERARIATESLAPGVRIVDVARRHGVTRWQVYYWRRKLTAGTLAIPAEATAEPAFAALVVEPSSAVPIRKARTAQKSSEWIELVVAGVTMRVAGDVEEAQLRRVIRAVRAASA